MIRATDVIRQGHIKYYLKVYTKKTIIDLQTTYIIYSNWSKNIINIYSIIIYYNPSSENCFSSMCVCDNYVMFSVVFAIH